MRKIEFRGKCISRHEKTGEWVYGYIYFNGRCHWIVNNDLFVNDHYEVDPETVGQYTGLKDSKRTAEYPEGQPIYEGDILQNRIGSNNTWIVMFEDGSFVLEQIGGHKAKGRRKHAQNFCCEDDIGLFRFSKFVFNQAKRHSASVDWRLDVVEKIWNPTDVVEMSVSDEKSPYF